MGNDGGCFIKSRADLCKVKPNKIKIDNNIQAKNRSRLCQISKQPLRHPIAVCRAGYLYSYDVIIQTLVDKKMPSAYLHISGLKDIRKINEHSYAKEAQLVQQQKQIQNKNEEEEEYPIKCPITRVPYNGMNKFIVLWKCGCCMSEKAIQATLTDLKCAGKDKQQKAEQNNEKKPIEFPCVVCQTINQETDILSLNQSADLQAQIVGELITQKDILNKQKKQQKTLKKQSKKELKEETKKFEEEGGIKMNTKKVKTNEDHHKHIQNKTILPKQEINTDKGSYKNILDRLNDGEALSQSNNGLFKSLFHSNEGKCESDLNLIFRDVRNGLR